MTNESLPDKVYVRAVTDKTLSAVRPDSPIAQAEWSGRLKRTEYIRADLTRATPQIDVEGIKREVCDVNKSHNRAEAKMEKTKWQPIETAPKDGTEMLVCMIKAGVLIAHIAWYRSKSAWETSGKYCGSWDTLEEWEGWWSYTENSIRQTKINPTHWMPLPDAPEQL